jgi:hypothetical protein
MKFGPCGRFSNIGIIGLFEWRLSLIILEVQVSVAISVPIPRTLIKKEYMEIQTGLGVYIRKDREIYEEMREYIRRPLVI